MFLGNYQGGLARKSKVVDDLGVITDGNLISRAAPVGA